MSFGDVLRFSSATYTGTALKQYVAGIGGSTTVIFAVWTHLSVDRINELSTYDLSVIRYANSPSGAPWGAGGDSEALWHASGYYDKAWELNILDFSVLTEADTAGAAGIGGSSTCVWNGTDVDKKIYRLSTLDLSEIQEWTVLVNYCDIGGDASTVWAFNEVDDLICELSTTDMSVIRSADQPDSGIYGSGGVGGKEDVLWFEHRGVSPYSDRIYELDTEYSSAQYLLAGTLRASGIMLEYGDSDNVRREIEGDLTGSNRTYGSVKTGEVWLYGDEDGKEREFEGDLNGESGTYGSIGYEGSGTTLRYIDNSTHKREYEGAMA